MNIPPSSARVVIVKDLGWHVFRSVIDRMADGTMRVTSIAISCPPCQEEHAAAPAEGVFIAGADTAFDALAAFVDEVRSMKVDNKLIQPQ